MSATHTNIVYILPLKNPLSEYNFESLGYDL